MIKNSKQVWYLLIDKRPLPGSLNMAVDHYLFHSLDENAKTFVRFYRWERPTASLGYSQRVYKVADVDFCQRNGIDLVRRMTGGKLVLHHKEVTYSVCSSDSQTFPPTVGDSYKLISEALMRGLEKMGLKPYLANSSPDFYARGNLPCFSYPARNEIEIMGKKIIGSAQKRVGSRFIQHGSIPLEKEDGLLESVSRLGSDQKVIRLISLSEALGKKVDFTWVVEHLKIGFSEYFDISFQPKSFRREEMEKILKIQKERYGHRAWTFLRK